MSTRYQGSYTAFPHRRAGSPRSTRGVAAYMRTLRRQAAEDRNARTPHERRHGGGSRPCTCPAPPQPPVVEVAAPVASMPPAPTKKKRWAWRGDRK